MVVVLRYVPNSSLQYVSIVFALAFLFEEMCIYILQLLCNILQAAEKAMKAVQVQRDAKNVTNDHHLCSSVATRENSELRDLAQELENIIVNYSRLRYPRLNEFPYAPSELYTTENAVKTIELATKIIDIVDDTYFSN
jgi:HEPN domain-containing protein